MNPDDQKNPQLPAASFSETAPIEETLVVVPPGPQNEPPPVAPTICIDSFSIQKQEEGEEGLPGALMAAPTQPGSAGVRLRDPWRLALLTPKRAALAGLALGLALGVWLYLRPWPLARPFAPPAALASEPLSAAPGQTAPPRQWVWEAGCWFGRDSAGGLGMRDPDGGLLGRAEGPIPDIIHPGRFSLVGRPPLEPAVTLAWIQEAGASGATSATLRVARIDLATSAAALPEIPLAMALPAGSYPFAPVVVDHPDPQAGLLLVAAEKRGTLTAWRLGETAPAEPAWRLAPDNPLSPPPLVCPPRPVLEWEGGKPAVRLLILTAEGVTVLDAATGKPEGAPLKWRTPLAGDRTAALARFPAAGTGSSWIVSDGKRLETFTLNPGSTGATGSADVSSAGRAGLLARSSWSLPQDLGPAPCLLALPHPNEGGGPDDIVALGADGRTAWLSGPAAVPGPRLPEFLDGPAAIDLNGDGSWDLAGVGRDGALWIVDGQRREIVEFKTKGKPVSGPGGSVVRWRLTARPGAGGAAVTGLEASYMDGEGRIRRALWPLATPCDPRQSEFYLRIGI